jgi:hypothetical protein
LLRLGASFKKSESRGVLTIILYLGIVGAGIAFIAWLLESSVITTCYVQALPDPRTKFIMTVFAPVLFFHRMKVRRKLESEGILPVTDGHGKKRNSST